MFEPIIFLENEERKLQKNAQKREKYVFQNFLIFSTHDAFKTVRLRKLKLARYLKNILFFYQKKFGAKILINNKVIKVLLTEGTKPISKIIEKILTMKI